MHRKSRKIIQLTKKQESSYYSKIIFHPALEIIRNSKGIDIVYFERASIWPGPLSFCFGCLLLKLYGLNLQQI